MDDWNRVEVVGREDTTLPRGREPEFELTVDDVARLGKLASLHLLEEDLVLLAEALARHLAMVAPLMDADLTQVPLDVTFEDGA